MKKKFFFYFRVFSVFMNYTYTYILPWCLINNVINKVERKTPFKKRLVLNFFLFCFLNLNLEKNPIRSKRKVKETLKKRLYL